MTQFNHPLDLLRESDVFDHNGDAAILAVARGETSFIIHETAAERLKQFGWTQEPLPDPPFYIAPMRVLRRYDNVEALKDAMMDWKLADHCKLYLKARDDGFL